MSYLMPKNVKFNGVIASSFFAIFEQRVFSCSLSKIGANTSRRFEKRFRLADKGTTRRQSAVHAVKNSDRFATDLGPKTVQPRTKNERQKRRVPDVRLRIMMH